MQAMPIRGFLAGQAFEPEVVRQMSLALETVCGKFGMKLTEDPATRVVALKIIELAQRGVRDAPTLTNDAARTQALFAVCLKWPRPFVGGWGASSEVTGARRNRHLNALAGLPIQQHSSWSNRS